MVTLFSVAIHLFKEYVYSKDTIIHQTENDKIPIFIMIYYTHTHTHTHTHIYNCENIINKCSYSFNFIPLHYKEMIDYLWQNTTVVRPEYR